MWRQGDGDQLGESQCSRPAKRCTVEKVWEKRNRRLIGYLIFIWIIIEEHNIHICHLRQGIIFILTKALALHSGTIFTLPSNFIYPGLPIKSPRLPYCLLKYNQYKIYLLGDRETFNIDIKDLLGS